MPPPLSDVFFLEKLFHFQCNMLPSMLAYVEVGKALLLGIFVKSYKCALVQDLQLIFHVHTKCWDYMVWPCIKKNLQVCLYSNLSVVLYI